MSILITNKINFFKLLEVKWAFYNKKSIIQKYKTIINIYIPQNTRKTYRFKGRVG